MRLCTVLVSVNNTVAYTYNLHVFVNEFMLKGCKQYLWPKLRIEIWCVFQLYILSFTCSLTYPFGKKIHVCDLSKCCFVSHVHPLIQV